MYVPIPTGTVLRYHTVVIDWRRQRHVLVWDIDWEGQAIYRYRNSHPSYGTGRPSLVVRLSNRYIKVQGPTVNTSEEHTGTWSVGFWATVWSLCLCVMRKLSANKNSRYRHYCNSSDVRINHPLRVPMAPAKIT